VFTIELRSIFFESEILVCICVEINFLWKGSISLKTLVWSFGVDSYS
jgi:hypothetical protein